MKSPSTTQVHPWYVSTSHQTVVALGQKRANQTQRWAAEVVTSITVSHRLAIRTIARTLIAIDHCAEHTVMNSTRDATLTRLRINLVLCTKMLILSFEKTHSTRLNVQLILKAFYARAISAVAHYLSELTEPDVDAHSIYVFTLSCPRYLGSIYPFHLLRNGKLFPS